jgi:hypothetical protein
LNQNATNDLFEFKKAASKFYSAFIKKLAGEPWKKQDKLLNLFAINTDSIL